MRTGFLLSAGLLLSCGNSTAPSNSTDDSHPRGTVGAHVWFASSESLELRNVWAANGPGSVPTSGSNCWFFEKSALSSAQRALLEGLTLVPLTDACMADGFNYHELMVVERDGSEFVYRDTGCSFLRVDGAMAMLPANAFFGDAFLGGSPTACPLELE